MPVGVIAIDLSDIQLLYIYIYLLNIKILFD